MSVNSNAQVGTVYMVQVSQEMINRSESFGFMRKYEDDDPDSGKTVHAMFGTMGILETFEDDQGNWIWEYDDNDPVADACRKADEQLVAIANEALSLNLWFIWLERDTGA